MVEERDEEARDRRASDGRERIGQRPSPHHALRLVADFTFTQSYSWLVGGPG